MARVRVGQTVIMAVTMAIASDCPRPTRARRQGPVFRVALSKESVDCLSFLVPKMLDFLDFAGQVPSPDRGGSFLLDKGTKRAEETCAQNNPLGCFHRVSRLIYSVASVPVVYPSCSGEFE